MKFIENFFGGLFWRILLAESFRRNNVGEILCEEFLGGLFWEEFFVCIGLSKFCLNKERRRRKDKKFRSLEVRRKLIALRKSGSDDHFEVLKVSVAKLI